MPSVTRSNASKTRGRKRICIEVETPLIPKLDNIGTFQQNKKRKLDKEFSLEWDGSSRKTNAANKKKKTNNMVVKKKQNGKKERVQNVNNTSQNVDNTSQNVDNTSQRQTRRKKYQNDVSNKTEVLPISENNEIIEKLQHDLTDNFHQKPVTEAVENISSNESDGQESAMCSCKSSEVGSTDRNQHKVIEIDEECYSQIQEQTAINADEDYQQKYFQLLQMMKSLQEELLTSQQKYEQHVAANDDFLEEIKTVLEDKHNELLLTTKELEHCRAENFELENCKRQHEVDMKALKTEAEALKEAVSSNNHTNDGEIVLMQQIDDQRNKLECYKTLTGLLLEKASSSSAEASAKNCSMFQSFVCSVTPKGSANEVKFSLTQDREFAEIEYKPLCADETKERYPGLPVYLQEKIFFVDEQAPNFLLRLLRSIHGEKRCDQA